MFWKLNDSVSFQCLTIFLLARPTSCYDYEVDANNGNIGAGSCQKCPCLSTTWTNGKTGQTNLSELFVTKCYGCSCLWVFMLWVFMSMGVHVMGVHGFGCSCLWVSCLWDSCDICVHMSHKHTYMSLPNSQTVKANHWILQNQSHVQNLYERDPFQTKFHTNPEQSAKLTCPEGNTIIEK
jgi:hypothetical protein